MILGWFCFQVKIQISTLFLCSHKGMCVIVEDLISVNSCYDGVCIDDCNIIGKNGSRGWSIFETTLWKANCWYWNHGERRPWPRKQLCINSLIISRFLKNLEHSYSSTVLFLFLLYNLSSFYPFLNAYPTTLDICQRSQVVWIWGWEWSSDSIRSSSCLWTKLELVSFLNITIMQVNELN